MVDSARIGAGEAKPTAPAAPTRTGRVAGPQAPPNATSRRVPTPRGRRRAKPVFIVSSARSGSTLLRYFLDSHPDLTAPPELNLASLLQHVVDVSNQANLALGSPAPGPDGVPPAEVCARARRVIDEIIAPFAQVADARFFCDKSLVTVDHLPVVRACFPKAPLIFLYRYPLDVIASGLEASQWGFSAYGFTPYAAANPGNFVAALANYWLDRAAKMSAFEESCSGPHARIYYELLCDDPAATLSALFDFLEVPASRTVIARAFSQTHQRGPADYKIDFTDGVSVDSIGRGALLPELIPPPLAARIDELLARLDYPELAAGWRGELPALLGLKGARREESDLTESVASLLAQRASAALTKRHRAALPFEVVVRTGTGDGAPLLIDRRGTVARVEDPGQSTRPRVRCIGDVLLRVAAGEVDFAKAVHDRRIRVERDVNLDEPTEPRPQAVLAALAAITRPGA